MVTEDVFSSPRGQTSFRPFYKVPMICMFKDKPQQKPTNSIRWQRAFTSGEDGRFFGLDAKKCADIFGLDTYIRRYGHMAGFPDMRQHEEEFDDWQLTVPFHRRSLAILCCPEDRICGGTNGKTCVSASSMCKDCELPICFECEEALWCVTGSS